MRFLPTAFLGVLLALRCLGADLAIGTKDRVRYSGGATEQDARALGDTLKTMGFFADLGADVMLSRGEGGVAISFVVERERWKDVDLIAFEQIGRGVASALGGLPIQVRIVDTELKFVTESTIQPPLPIGARDHVLASGAASQKDAQALGDALKSDGFFQDRGAEVMLYKGDGGTVLTFGVRGSAASQNIAAVEYVVRDIAPAIGGLPIKLRLVSTELEVKRELMVHPGLKFGRDVIYYSDAATEEEAKAMGAVLQSTGIFEGKGAVVLLSKGNEGAVVSFLVKKSTWVVPKVVNFYKQAGHDVAPSIGGLPIKVRLINDEFESKKEVEVR